MLTKQPININFFQGLDTKTDPFQVQPGKFLTLQNSIFDKAGQLTKRNGFGLLTSLPDNTSRYLTTFNNNLTAIGSNITAFSSGTNTWVNKGSFKSIDLTTLPAVRGSTYSSQADSVTASNGLTCIAYTEQVPIAGTITPSYRYVVIDSLTGQNVVASTVITGADATYGTPRVFLLSGYFVILYTTHPSAYHIEYIAISTSNPTVVTTPVTVTTSYIPSTTVAFDGLVVNSSLFIAYNTTSGGQSVKVTYISSALGTPVTAQTYSGEIGTLFSLAGDMTTPSSPRLYVSYYDDASKISKTLVVDQNLNPVLAPTTFNTTDSLLNLTSIAQNGSVVLYYEVLHAYGYDGAIPTNYIKTNQVTIAGTVSTAYILNRGIGLASKAFLYNGTTYFLTIYSSEFQPTYFLMAASSFGAIGTVAAKLAYSNAGNYFLTGIPNVTVSGSSVMIAYLYRDLIQSVNKAQGVSNSAGVYAQLGVNLVDFDMAPPAIVATELGQNLNLSGGYVSMYDGVYLTEQGFFLYPDSVETTISSPGGMSAQRYYYQVTYEWADNQGNVFRSAPSLPVHADVSGANESVIVDIPTLRLTYKIDNPVTIVLYRWSTAQQEYYQTTSITAPLLNDPTVDYVTYTDVNSDADILGNNLIYTTGGVIEDIAPPTTSITTLFNNRMWLVDSEDRNLLWYSKQVIEATPVEFSDLLTLYIAPTTASEGSTGPITALSPMDDKLIVFKANALGYINGIGPDNTGANSQYSDFVLINSVVGCTNSASIVFTPAGLMFQSNKGIWMVGRDLSTSYIGAPVEDLTIGATVLSALNIPSTNQVRFTLDSGITLMYDYYFGQWGTFVNIPALSSTVYQNLHTYVNSLGQVFQETVGSYLDNSSPVLMSFTTSWIALAGLQGYERFYEMLLLGTYKSPFRLAVSLQYDYNIGANQTTLVTPVYPGANWGGEQLWGSGSLWGGNSATFEARVFPQKQKCESFQVSIIEQYDSTIGPAAGAGLTLSGLNLIVGMKRINRTSSTGRSFG